MKQHEKINYVEFPGGRRFHFTDPNSIRGRSQTSKLK